VNCLVKRKQIKSNSSLVTENKAQAEAVFRLMIDSVVGLAILLIIVSLINYFNTQVIEQSKNDFVTLVKSSVSASNGSIITSSGDLTFARGFGVDGLDAQNWTQVNEKCFHFVSSASEGSIKLVGDTKVEFSQTLAIKVYSQCVPDQSCNPYDPENSCCMQCTISFGKKLE
jgi:hypothetical protein